jgi:Mus7/MMS22 family
VVGSDLDVTDQLVKSSHEIPAALTSGLLNLLAAFFDGVHKKFVVPAFQPPPPALDEDSQDYGDSAFLEEFVAVQETSNFSVGQNISTICTHLYRVIANLFAAAPKSQPVGPIIDTWIHGLSILVAHRQQDWSTFLQYGGEWERLRSTNSRMSRAWGPVILTKILKADPTAYFQGQDHFISAWFESIIEADLEGQHALTELLLNIDDGGTILENSVFAKNMAGIYQISADALFEARPTLIVRMNPRSQLF